MTVSLVTAVWKRPAIERLVLEHYRDLAADSSEQVRLYAACSTDDDEALVAAAGWEPCRIPNRPLGRKWNKAADAARGSDAVVVVGSDDLILPRPGLDLFAHFRVLAEKHSLAGPTDLYVVDTASGEGLLWRNPPHIIGPGRVLCGDVMEALRWAPWPPQLNKRLDGGMNRRIARTRARRWAPFSAEEIGFDVVDLKSERNIWGFDMFARRVEGRTPLSRVFRYASAELRAALGAAFPALTDKRGNRTC